MKWRRIRRCLYVIICLALIAFVVVAWKVGSSLIAPANHVVGPPSTDLPLIATTFNSESGATLSCWYATPPNAHATIVLLHGIRADRRSMLGRAKLFYNAGYAVMMIDLQAHGESTGENITAGYLEKFDAAAAVKFAREKNPTHKIGIDGFSLGGAATVLASPLKVDAMLLEAVYPTITEAVENRMEMRFGSFGRVVTPALLFQLKPRLGISVSDLKPIDHIANIGCPVMIIGGEQDEHTTLTETNRIFETAAEPKSLVVFQNAKHTDFYTHDAKLFEEQTLAFFNKHLQSNTDSQ
jgi:alpha-beta hydrolase superfamily lysophospholipase